MTYDEAIRFWYSRINYETRAARPEDLKLERMRELLHRLGNPQDELEIVHIAGTKGKGSTAAMIAALARAAGRKVGLFTSPHLMRVEERIQIDGVPISENDLAALMTVLKPVIDDLDAGPYSPVTFFEIVTAMGWMHFQRNRVGLAIIEVGLGGRFDSTNVCHPAVSVITNIGFDHMSQLGGTLEEIAFQKAGIIKPGVLVISGVTEPGPREVIRRVASENDATCREYGIDFQAAAEPLSLQGEHQRVNAAIALEAAKVLFDCDARALAEVDWPARIEVVSESPRVILDCAHNVPSIEALVKTVRSSFPATGKKTCIFAVSSDKQYELMLPILALFFDAFILTQYGNNPRCVPPEKLASLLPATVEKQIIVPAMQAWHIARAAAGCEDLIAITGSVFLAGELNSAVRVG